MPEGVYKVHENGGVVSCVRSLYTNNNEILVKALGVVELCTREEWISGQVFSLNILNRILDLLSHNHNDIRLHVARILVNLTHREDVRKDVMFRKGVHSLLHALKDSDDVMKKILIQVMTNLSKN